MSFIIVFLMVSSILAIWQGTGSSSDIPSYNDYDISLDGNKYKIKSDFGTIFGYTYPSVLEKYKPKLKIGEIKGYEKEPKNNLQKYFFL